MERLIPIVLAAALLGGCVSTKPNNYAACLETQKSISRDMTVMEAARVAALVEMTKSADPAVRSSGLLLLQQKDVKSITINCHPY